jgi:hypothetical protein
VTVTVEDVFELVPEDSLIAKAELLNQANGSFKLGINKARSFVNELVANSRLFEHKVKRPRTNPAIFLGVFPPEEETI